jgi:hypothetical protein
MIRLLPIDAVTYRPSELHAEDRVWIETNCYVDLWIELLNALGLDYGPALAFTLSVDFDGDQWQFFKFPTEDLRALYGLDVAEMNPWRGLEHHIDEQLAMGRFLIAEVDAWYLPDARDSYRLEHVKTAIAPNLIDRDGRRLGYFHNSGYYELDGDDFEGMLRAGRHRPEILPPYVELVKLDRLHGLDSGRILDQTRALVRAHLERRPETNPVQRFRKRLEQDVEWLAAEELSTFHQYAFATLRQFGSAVELAGSLCAWLAARGEPTADAGHQFGDVASCAKTAQFQLARLVSGRKLDVEPTLDAMERGWDAAMHELGECYG